MTLFQAIILAVVQGISEFLPISSKGHLNLASYFLGVSPSLALDIFLNTATLLSVIFYFRHRVAYFIKNLPFIIVGSVPAVVAGLVFKHKIESLVTNIKLLPYFLLITTAYLLISKFLKKSNQSLTYFKAIIIGMFQSFALLPGISRSGSTIFAGLITGLSTTDSFDFSFALFIPASIGALVLDLKDLQNANFFQVNYFISFILTFLVGLGAIHLLQKTLKSSKFWLFGIYTFILALSLLVLFH